MIKPHPFNEVYYFRDNILNGDVKFVLKSNGRSVLTIAGLDLVVIELSAIERKIEIKSFLFTIVKRLTELKKQVSGMIMCVLYTEIIIINNRL